MWHKTVRLFDAFDRYEHEYTPQLRPSARERTLFVVKHARLWFVGNPRLKRVTPADIDAFLAAQLARGVAPRTRNIYRSNLHRIFNLCIRPWGWLRVNPVGGTEPLRHDAREPRILSEEEYAELRRACSPNRMLSLFLTLAWETGGRHGELLQLQWRDIDFEQGTLTFRNEPSTGRTTKGRRSRTLPLSTAAVEALRHAPRRRKSPWVIHHTQKCLKGVQLGGKVRCMRKPFQRAAARIGIERLRVHDLRHAFVTRKLAAGVPAQLVQRYVGHANLTTTLAYTHLVPEHLRAVVE